MKQYLFIAALLCAACGTTSNEPDMTLFDFTTDTPGNAWEVEDDTVMGGRSQGQLAMTEDGHARFYGEVSLENDGGFSSIQHRFDPVASLPAGAGAFLVRLKSDGSDYTLRVQEQSDQRHFYQATFSTAGGEWETVRVPFDDMKPVWRGEPVDAPDFAGEQVRTVQFLIGNKKAQNFEVLIDRIGVE